MLRYRPSHLRIFSRLPVMSVESHNRDIVCIAASMGGIRTIPEVLSRLKPELPATILVTQHISEHGKCYLGDLFAARCSLDCQMATQDAPIRRGVVYIAPPGRHLMMTNDRIRLVNGPRENFSRPAADPMFRAAAAAFRGRVIGIVLTGLMQAGTSGMQAVKRCGGLTAVQRPEQAIAPGMPQSALQYCDVDHVLSAEEIGESINRWCREPAGPMDPPPSDIIRELEYHRTPHSDMANEEMFGELSPFMCPDCNGQLWRSEAGGLSRFRCHVGHAHTLVSLVEAHRSSADRQAWSLMRTYAERQRLLVDLADRLLPEATEEREQYRIEAELVDQQASLVREAILLDGQADEAAAMGELVVS